MGLTLFFINMLTCLFTRVVGQVERCACVPGGSCNSQPYGTLALDISVLGLFAPCPAHGHVRCCSRAGLEQLYEGMLLAALSHKDSGEIKVRPVLPGRIPTPEEETLPQDEECGCIPRGICMPHLVSTTAACHGQHEMCCISSVISRNILVQVFAANSRALEVQRELERTIDRVLPELRKQPVFMAPHHRETVQRGQLTTGDQEDAVIKGVPCLPVGHCVKVDVRRGPARYRQVRCIAALHAKEPPPVCSAQARHKPARSCFRTTAASRRGRR